MGKTAAELTKLERKKYRDLAVLEEESERRQEAARRDKALAVAHTAAAVLKEVFGASRVFLFGSLAAGGRFHARSDIDLGVEGLRSEDYWRADCRIEGVGGDLEIELVDLQTASAALAQAIRRDGREL